MTLYIIGLGLQSPSSVSIEGREMIDRCNKLYLECYTSVFTDAKLEDVEKYFGKPTVMSNRKLIEQDMPFIEEAREKDVAVLIIGDVFSATTHMAIIEEAEEQSVEVRVAHGVSVLTAVGAVGLELYKYGKVTSIPFDYSGKAPYEALQMNKQMGLHTLFLLDLRPLEGKFMTSYEGVQYLLQEGLDSEERVICCSQLGGKREKIHSCKAKDVKEMEGVPQCLIIPGNMHFMEEEMSKKWA